MVKIKNNFLIKILNLLGFKSKNLSKESTKQYQVYSYEREFIPSKRVIKKFEEIKKRPGYSDEYSTNFDDGEYVYKVRFTNGEYYYYKRNNTQKGFKI